jgi:fucose permease
MILNVFIWGIMFPHILGHALTVYKNDGGTVGSNLGFTFFTIAGATTYSFGLFFKNNFSGIAKFTFILSIVTVILVVLFNIVLRKGHVHENL